MDTVSFKKHLLEELYKPYANLKNCPVNTQGCTKLVFGEGNPNADLMFIGEAPGKDEDMLGHPFVGRSGKLLNHCLQQLGVKREDVFITNVVKCRPPENRKPLPSEVAFFKPILLHEIKIVRPSVICTLGSSALEALFNEPFSMTKIRGKLLSFEGIPLVPTFHPAYILRNQAAEPEFKHDLAIAVELAKASHH
jgi:uracil-DNA glycosylase